MSISKYMYIRNPKHNFFDLSHSNAFTTKQGKVTPNLVVPMYPGDRFKIESTSKTYTMPMITSPFQRIDASQRFFFVPLRELMNLGQFDDYITGGKDLETTVVRPTVNSGSTGYEAGSLMDYLGHASNYLNDDGQKVIVANKTDGAWALRAYNKIINDYYINPDIDEERVISLDAGLDTTTDRTLYDASWRPDYFTENLPKSGRGSDTLIPIGSSAPVKGNGKTIGLTNGEVNVGLLGGDGSHVYDSSDLYDKNVGSAGGLTGVFKSLGVTTDGSKSGLVADLANTAGVNVDELFALFGIDAYKKLSMRIGSKINEFLLGIWGVKPRDLRLHRSLYLGGRVSPIIIEEVDQTSATTDNGTPQANLAARGVSVNSGGAIDFTSDDYGVLIGVYCCMPQAKYFQGTPRWFEYEDYLDWPNPRLALLGDQITKMSEIYTQGDNDSTVVGSETVTNDTIFGFNPKYEEVRTLPSSIHGQFKTTMKYYTLARELPEPPLLNTSFLHARPSKRIFAVIDPNEDELRVETGFKISAWRKFSKFGNPAVMRLFM